MPPTTLNSEEPLSLRADLLFGVAGIGCADFPSFSEGLSLRERVALSWSSSPRVISLPFRRDFH